MDGASKADSATSKKPQQKGNTPSMDSAKPPSALAKQEVKNIPRGTERDVPGRAGAATAEAAGEEATEAPYEKVRELPTVSAVEPHSCWGIQSHHCWEHSWGAGGLHWEMLLPDKDLPVAKASQIINAQLLYHRILTCTNIAFSSSIPYSLELFLTRRRRPLVTPSRVWWQPVTLRRSLVPCRAPQFCSAGVGVQAQTVGNAQEGRAQPLSLVLWQQHRTFWNCQCSCKGTNLGQDWLRWGLCVLQELLGVLLSEHSH